MARSRPAGTLANGIWAAPVWVVDTFAPMVAATADGGRSMWATK